jgi:flavin-dependent dehydrogenase
VHVRVIDRCRFPRDKLCGDTLNPGAVAMLDTLGVAGALHTRALPVLGMIVTGPRNARVAGRYGAGIQGAALTRRDLDVALLYAAMAAGAQFDDGLMVTGPLMHGTRVTGVRVRSTAGAENIRAPLVVAADGRHSRLAFGLGLSRCPKAPRRWAFGAYYAGVADVTAFGEMHIRPDGYIGIAPVPGGLANVCVVRDCSACRGQELHGDVIARAIGRDHLLRHRFAMAERVGSVRVLGPMAVESRGAGVAGLLLAGDAAGFIDPMTGDGLRFAIRGGELAAAAALRELHTGTPQHDSLDAVRRREFAAKWRMNRTLRALVGVPWGVRTAAALTTLWSRPVQALIPLAGDVAVARRLHQR